MSMIIITALAIVVVAVVVIEVIYSFCAAWHQRTHGPLLVHAAGVKHRWCNTSSSSGAPSIDQRLEHCAPH